MDSKKWARIPRRSRADGLFSPGSSAVAGRDGSWVGGSVANLRSKRIKLTPSEIPPPRTGSAIGQSSPRGEYRPTTAYSRGMPQWPDLARRDRNAAATGLPPIATIHRSMPAAVLGALGTRRADVCSRLCFTLRVEVLFIISSEVPDGEGQRVFK